MDGKEDEDPSDSDLGEKPEVSDEDKDGGGEGLDGDKGEEMSEGCENEDDLEKGASKDSRKGEQEPEQETAAKDEHTESESNVKPDSEPEHEYKQEGMTLACLRCKAVVSRPCFYCLDCPCELCSRRHSRLCCSPYVVVANKSVAGFSTQRFICWDCDAKVAGFNEGKHHKATHSLVRCIPKSLKSTEETDLTVETRLGSLEDKVKVLTAQMEEIKELLQTLVRGRTTGLSP